MLSASLDCIGITVNSLGPDAAPAGAPRSTRRENAKGMIDVSSFVASVSDSILGTFFSLAYAGESIALMADLPERVLAVLQRLGQGRTIPLK